MTQAEMVLMCDFARAYERRYRDTRKRGHCLSIEHRYDNGNAAGDGESVMARFGEDALWLGLQAWRDVPIALQSAVRISFGIGARSQTEYEIGLNQAIKKRGEKQLHCQTDLGLAAWLEAIKEMAGKDFELLYERL